MAGSSILAALLVVLAQASLCAGATLKITPTQKVVAMLTEMKAKGQSQMDEEQKIFAAYKEWADDESKRLGFEIQDGARQIEELVAFITKAESDVATFGEEISTLDAEINQLAADKKAAEELRAQQHAEYLKTSEDYAESVDALQRAIQVLSSQNYDRAQAESLLQRMSGSVPGAARVLSAFLQEGSRAGLRGASAEPGAPDVAAYEFQSGGIVELLKGLLTKFKGELSATEEAESNQAHEFNLVELHLTNTISKDTSDRDEKAVAKGKAAADSAKAQGELVEVKAEKAADEKLKADTEATFAVKAVAYEQNQKVRVQEIEAIGKAIEILSSDAVSGSYAKHINLAQVPRKGLSLLQLSRRTRRVGVKQQVAELLQKRARALGSRTLAQAAAMVGDNPFAKVIGLIESLISKLKAEAAAEAEHKAWCDDQLKENKLKREAKTAEVNKLRADIQALDATIVDQGNTIEKLVNEQAALTQALQEATTIRQRESAENAQTVADAAAGLEAVGRAVAILKEFYSSQAALLQQGRQVPELAAYRGQQSGSGGVVGMLEVIESDFARLKAETESTEKAAASEYDTFVKESEISKKQKHEAEVKLRLDKDQNEYVKGETEKDLQASQSELDAANGYFEELKPNCLVVQVSYEERVAKREQELEALKQAYEILDQKSAE